MTIIVKIGNNIKLQSAMKPASSSSRTIDISKVRCCSDADAAGGDENTISKASLWIEKIRVGVTAGRGMRIVQVLIREFFAKILTEASDRGFHRPLVVYNDGDLEIKWLPSDKGSSKGGVQEKVDELLENDEDEDFCADEEDLDLIDKPSPKFYGLWWQGEDPQMAPKDEDDDKDEPLRLADKNIAKFVLKVKKAILANVSFAPLASSSSSRSSSKSSIDIFLRDLNRKYPPEKLVRLFVDAASHYKLKARLSVETSVVGVRQSGVLWLDNVEVFGNCDDDDVIFDVNGDRLVEKNIKRFVLKTVFSSRVNVERKEGFGVIKFQPDYKFAAEDEQVEDGDASYEGASEDAESESRVVESRVLHRRFLQSLWVGAIEPDVCGDLAEEMVFINGISGLMKQFKKIRNKFFNR